jgi:hypothetical protein
MSRVGLYATRINVDYSYLTREFIWTILRRLHTTVITHTFTFNITQTRVFCHSCRFCAGNPWLLASYLCAEILVLS